MTRVDTAPPHDEKNTTVELQRSFLRHLQYTLIKDKYSATKSDLYHALVYAVRDVSADHRTDTRQAFRKQSLAAPGKIFTRDTRL